MGFSKLSPKSSKRVENNESKMKTKVKNLHFLLKSATLNENELIAGGMRSMLCNCIMQQATEKPKTRRRKGKFQQRIIKHQVRSMEITNEKIFAGHEQNLKNKRKGIDKRLSNWFSTERCRQNLGYPHFPQ